MAIALYKKGRTHTAPSESDPENLLDCTVVIVSNNSDRETLIAQGDHFDNVDDLYLPPKAKRGRSKTGEKAAEVVESAESEPAADTDEDENRAD